MVQAATEQRLRAIRGDAPQRSPTVRVLAAYSGHASCNLATLGFVARVDFDRLLKGTPYEASFGQSPFAFSRGKLFERLVAENGYGAMLDLLRTTMGFAIDDARIENLRQGYPPNNEGMRLRAHETRRSMKALILGDRNAPNLIDGAVLETMIAGVRARFEADALAARFGGPIHAGEIKSFPVVDGAADPDKVAAALDQVALYILLTRQLVDDLGGDPGLVSGTAMLITPKNVGLTPTLSIRDVTKRVARMGRLVMSIPNAGEIVAAVPAATTFNTIANEQLDAQHRLDTLHALADHIGTDYTSSCLSTCGNARFCRERAFRDGLLCLSGPQTVRLLPGVHSLGRAAELSAGAPPSVPEAPVATLLARAGRLYDDAVSAPQLNRAKR